MVYRVLIIMITFILLFSGLTDYYFYKRAIVRFSFGRIARITHFTLSALGILLNLWLAFEFTNPNADPTSTVYVWGILFYFIFYLPKLVFMIISSPELLFNKTRIFSITGAILGILALFILIWGALVGRFQFETRMVDSYSKNLPKAFEGYKIVQFSDTHLGNFGHSDKIVHQLVEQINAQQADLIVFTGDLVNTKATEVDRYKDVLLKLKAKDGVYSVLGNHDYGDYVFWKSKADREKNIADLIQKQKDLNWKLLRNETKFLYKGNDSIALIGVENWGEPPFHQYGDLDLAWKPIGNYNSYKLLLSHNPEHWRQIVVPKYNIDLTLAGHTHAWQMVFKIGNQRFSPAVFKYKHWGGLYTQNNKNIYVNEGIGYVLYPMRFGTGPEITVITLKRSK